MSWIRISMLCCMLLQSNVQSFSHVAHFARRLGTTKTTTTTSLSMVQNRGLEVNREGPTPTAGGMTLYLKAGPDGESVGDCPFAHFVRLVLEEKGLEYTLRPSTQETKPNWLIEHYEGKMPALRHRKECYVESSIIAEYLDFFFQEPKLKSDDTNVMQAAEEAVDGFFPAVAQYLKQTEDDVEANQEKLDNLKVALGKLEEHLSGDYMCGDSITLLDCSLIPKLYHLMVGIEGFKNGNPNLEEEFPRVSAYMKRVMERPSFKATEYPKETILWGWGNARS